MSEPLDDPVAEPRLARAIRDALDMDRPSTAPASLRSRIDAVPADAPRSAGAWFARRPLLGVAAFAGLATVAALLLVARIGPLLGLEHVGGPAGSTVPSFDPTIEGQGILHDVAPTLQWIPELVLLLTGGAIVVIAVRWLRRVDRRRRSTVLGVVLAGVAAGSVALSQHPGFEWAGGSYGPLLGCCVEVSAPGSRNATTFYETAVPGGPAGVGFDVTNPGPLPIRIEGLVQPLQVNQGVLHWTSVWLAPDPHAFPNPLTDLVPFRPVEVAPGDHLTLYLVGKAGPCAYGPTFALDAAGVGGYFGIDQDLQLAYSVYGLERVGIFTLPFALVEPAREGCTG